MVLLLLLLLFVSVDEADKEACNCIGVSLMLPLLSNWTCNSITHLV